MNKDYPISERDLRYPAFTNVESLDELERNDFGQIVRKDRFETALRKLYMGLYANSPQVWFVETLTGDLRGLLDYLRYYELSGDDLHDALTDFHALCTTLGAPEPGETAQIEVLFQDGSFLRNVDMSLRETPCPDTGRIVDLTWHGIPITTPIQAMRNQTHSLPVLAVVQDGEALTENSTMTREDYAALLKQLDTPNLAPTPPKPYL